MTFRALTAVLMTFLTSALGGCLYGTCMNGPCALEHERIVKSIKPYLHYWEKPGMTEQSRLEDSWQCGAGPGRLWGESVQFSPEQERTEQRVDEKTVWPARARLKKAWVACMRARGYQYVEASEGRR